MKILERLRPVVENKFKKHPKFYRVYDADNKLNIAFSDMVLAITLVGWDVFFVEVLHKKSPTEVQLAYAKLCKNRGELYEMLEKSRDTYERPKHLEAQKRIGFRVDIKDMFLEMFKNHPKFIQIYEGYKKLFIVFDDILILVEPIGGTFYSWELFKREGEVGVVTVDAGTKIGFNKIVDVVVELRIKYEYNSN